MMFHVVAIWASILLTAPAHGQAVRPESKANPVPKTNPVRAGKVLAEQAGSQPSQRQLIEFYERQLAESEKRGNWEAIARRLSPDFLEIGADGKTYNKEQVAAYFPQLQLHSYKLSEWEFRSLGPNAALLAYRSDVEARIEGQRLAGGFRVSSVWSRQDGGWKLKFHQATPVAKPSTAGSSGKSIVAEPEHKDAMPQAKLIESYERKLLEADKKGDWDTIARHMADDFLEIAGDGRFYDKQQIAELFPESRVSEYQISEVQLRALSAEAALLAYRLDVQATFRGRPLPGAFRVSSVWRKRAGKWKVLFHQGTPIPAGPSKQ